MKSDEESKSKTGKTGKTDKAGLIGLLVVAIKLLPKFLKVAKVGKVASAAASIGVYSAMFNWKFALIIITMLFVHESGHIWAMKRRGMHTKGIYFIPFLGGAAVTDAEFPSRGAETFIALAGPVWGLMYAGAALGCFYLTGSTFFVAVASWTALVTLFNLLPINPLDGGRVTKSIFYSINGKAGFIFMIASMALAVVIMIILNVWIFAIIIGLNVGEIIWDYRKLRSKRHDVDNLKNRIRQYRSKGAAFEEKVAVEELHKLTKDDKPNLTGRGIALATFGLLAIAGICFACMFLTAHIPGSELAMEVLID